MNLLWVKTELLHPLNKGGRIRTFHMVKELAKNNRVTYVCYADPVEEQDAIQELAQHVENVVIIPKKDAKKYTAGFYLKILKSLFTPHPYTIRNYYSQEMAEKIHELVEKDAFGAIVCDFLAPSMNFTPDLRKRSVLFQHNVESQIWKRHVSTQRNPIRKFIFYQEYKKLLHYEQKACREFRKVLAVSGEDRDWFASHYNLDHVVDIPTGVDTDYFRPSAKRPEPGNIVFTGSMDWLPNEDAVLWFVKEIMPLIRKEISSIKFFIVGRRPIASVRKLAEDHPDVVVTGDVDDIRPYVENASVFIVPIRIGGGTRLKIYEAMAMGKAVVSTTIGAEGLPLRKDEHFLAADTPQEFAGQVKRILTSEELAQHLGKAAHQYVVSNYAWDKVSDLFLKAITDLKDT